MVIFNEKLATFFEDHFKEKEVELQPKVINLDNFPHILSPDKLIVDSNPLPPPPLKFQKYWRQ